MACAFYACDKPGDVIRGQCQDARNVKCTWYVTVCKDHRDSLNDPQIYVEAHFYQCGKIIWIEEIIREKDGELELNL